METDHVDHFSIPSNIGEVAIVLRDMINCGEEASYGKLYPGRLGTNHGR